MSSIIPTEHRCGCGKLLFKGLVLSSELEIKCKNCHAINVIGQTETLSQPTARYSILFNPEGQIVNNSDSAPGILGYSKEELRSMKIQEMYPLLKLSAYLELSKISHFLDIEPFKWDTLCQRKDGSFILANINLRYVKPPSEGPTLTLFECVQSSNAGLSGLKLQSSDNEYCKFTSRVNTQGIFTYVNLKLATVLGYAPIEILGKSLASFSPKKNQQHLTQVFSRNLAQKESFKLSDHTLFCKNNNLVNFESYLALDLNDRGRPRGFQMMSWIVS